jgi:hypothetical protein
MSTKKLRDALWDMEHNGAGPQPALAREARLELEAIEKAAQALDGVGIRAAWHGDAWFARDEELKRLDAAADVLGAIAKGAS